MTTSNSNTEVFKNLVFPAYYRIVRRESNTWYFRKASLFSLSFSSSSSLSIDFEHLEESHGLTKSKVAIALFRINGGLPGYYLADLKHKVYQYCGADPQDVKSTFLRIGIGVMND